MPSSKLSPSELPVPTPTSSNSDPSAEPPPQYTPLHATSQQHSHPFKPHPAPTPPSTIPFQSYQLPHSTLSLDKTTTTTSSSDLTSDVPALLSLLQAQAALPPKPLVRIKGSHSEYGAAYGPDKIDFDVVLNVMPLLRQGGSLQVMPGEDQASSTGKGEKNGVMGDNGGSLEEWARRFCADDAESKSFVLERKVTNWDTEYLEGQIRTMIASTKYQGKLTVTFPIAHSKVVIRTGTASISEKASSWIGKLSPKKDSAFKESTRQYAVAQSLWPYANIPAGGQGRQYAAQSEQEWWEVWKEPVRNAVLGKKQGWVSAEEWMECAMGERAAEMEKAWGVGQQW
ncbi:hypothetical protein MMC28_004024 [Mycoblastus sanguinarius]|nr:hypothetical protein [Mycoblastus sanguinarius]